MVAFTTSGRDVYLMNRPLRANRAFTLLELLIVIAIIAVLAGISVPVYQSIMMAARRTQSLSNMRQFGAAFIAYCGDNDGMVPGQGDSTPTWSGAAQNTTTENAAWYNALPRTYGNTRGLGDYASNTAAFYTKASLFYVPAAKYPSTKLTAPLFAMAYNSKLIDKTYDNSDTTLVRLQNFAAPASTCVFQESGLRVKHRSAAKARIRVRLIATLAARQRDTEEKRSSRSPTGIATSSSERISSRPAARPMSRRLARRPHPT